MPQKRLPKQALLAKGKGQLDGHKHAKKPTLRILDGTAWSFNQAKCWRWWLNLELLPPAFPQPSQT